MRNIEKQQPHTRIQLHRAEDEIKSQNKQRRERPELSKKSLIAVLAIILFFLFWFSLLFPVPYRQFVFSPAYIFESVKRRFEQFFIFLFQGSGTFGITVYQYLAVILVGAALAACGTIFQGSFRNMLAGPSTMGVMSGGSLGCLLYLLFFTTSASQLQEYYTSFDLNAYMARSFLDIYGRQLFTLAGCFGGVALVMGVATIAGRGKLSSSAMILSGTVFSTITGNISRIIQYYMILNDPNDSRIETMREVMMGSFDSVTNWKTLLMMAVPILICLTILLLLRNRLNLLSMDEDEAVAAGINIRLYRNLVILLGTVLTAVVVAFCGHIGFLGFMIPLVGRKLAGPDMNRLLPVSMLIGAILLMLVFDAAYIAGLTSYLNIFTSSIGGIVMLITLLKKRGGARRAVVQG